MVKCSCISDNSFDFIIEHKDDHFLFIDKSKWVTSSVNIEATTHTVTISNGDLSKDFEFNIQGTTKIRYCELPSTNSCGSDGIYNFTVDSCGLIFTKCEAILPSVTCAYTKLLVRKPLVEYQTKVLPIFIQLEYIKANASICNSEEAIKHFNLLIKMIEHLNCKCPEILDYGTM